MKFYGASDVIAGHRPNNRQRKGVAIDNESKLRAPCPDDENIPLSSVWQNFSLAFIVFAVNKVANDFLARPKIKNCLRELRNMLDIAQVRAFPLAEKWLLFAAWSLIRRQRNAGSSRASRERENDGAKWNVESGFHDLRATPNDPKLSDRDPEARV